MQDLIQDPPRPENRFLTITPKANRQQMQEPTTWKLAIGVLALLLCLRRRRTGDPAPVDPETAKAEDEAFQLFNDSNDFP